MVVRNQLDALFQPKTFVLIGASDKSTFSKLLIKNLRDAGFKDQVHLVNPRSPIVHDQPTISACTELPTPADLAFVMVAANRVPDALRDAAASGTKAAIVLSSGYSEVGEFGATRQKEIVDLAAELGIVILGPNVLGYINVLDNIPAMALSDPPKHAGSVALISQSGASCAAMKDFAEMSGVGLSHVITVGNEACITIADIAAYLLEDTRVKALAIFMESIKRPDLFAEVALQAARKNIPIVVLKAGKSELAARAAASHTGALVGDDNVVAAMFAHLGVIRVDTVEDMLVTAGIGAYTGVLEPGGTAIASISGGACDIIADLAQDNRLTLPEFDPTTVSRLSAAMPEFGHAHNPLDVTGAALTTPGLWRTSIESIASDPNVSIIAVVNSLPWREDGRPFYGEPYVKEIGEALSTSATPGIYVTQVAQPIGKETRTLLERNGVPHTIAGLRGFVEGVAKVQQWSDRLRDLSKQTIPTPQASPDLPPGDASLSEWDSRKLFEDFEVPFVPTAAVTTANEAKVAAAEWPDSRSAIKILSPDIAHKSDVGGVALNVAQQDVADRTDAMFAEVKHKVPSATISGVLVSPMRDQATELIVGITRDDDWGLMLAVGIGGVLVEVLNDVVLAPLPVDTATVSKMLTRLRGRRILDEVRGRPAADLPRLAEVITRIAAAASAIGDRLETAEINPLRVNGSEIEALDALVILRDKF